MLFSEIYIFIFIKLYALVCFLDYTNRTVILKIPLRDKGEYPSRKLIFTFIAKTIRVKIVLERVIRYNFLKS